MPHPLVKQIVDTAHAAGMTFEQVDDKAGYATGRLSRWARTAHEPGLYGFIDYANAVGYNVELTPDYRKPIDIPAFLPLRRRRG